MSEYTPSFYVRLGLGVDADERAIKRAYAQILKTLNPELQAAEFEALRSDYTQALAYVKNPDADFFFDEGNFHFKVSGEEVVPRSNEASLVIINDRSESVDASVDNTSGESTTVTESAHEISGFDDLPTAANNAYDLATAEFQEFCKLINISKIQTLTNSEFSDLLKDFLKRETLLAFEVRLHFENMLIEALAQRHFGQTSARLLISCAALFNWNTADSSRLMDCGAAGIHVLFLLDSFSSLTDPSQSNLLRMSDTPNPDLSYITASTLQNYRSYSQQLYEYFVDVEHEKAWIQAKKDAPLAVKVAEKFLELKEFWEPKYFYWIFLCIFMAYKSYKGLYFT